MIYHDITISYPFPSIKMWFIQVKNNYVYPVPVYTMFHVGGWLLAEIPQLAEQLTMISATKRLVSYENSQWCFKAFLPETECTSPETNKWNPKMELWFRGYFELSFSFRSYDIRFRGQFQECIDIRFHVQFQECIISDIPSS